MSHPQDTRFPVQHAQVSSLPPVRVGVAALIRSQQCSSHFLLMHRQGSHGAGTWGLPGGHLEFGESFEYCAAREVYEELGLRTCQVLPGVFVTNDIMLSERKHYITLFMELIVSGFPVIREPGKCLDFGYFDLFDPPGSLFSPLQRFVEQEGWVALDKMRCDR